jgi:hypothetical protein
MKSAATILLLAVGVASASDFGVPSIEGQITIPDAYVRECFKLRVVKPSTYPFKLPFGQQRYSPSQLAPALRPSQIVTPISCSAIGQLIQVNENKGALTGSQLQAK